MITRENYEQKLLAYQELKRYIFSMKLTRQEFIYQIEKSTAIGVRVLNRLKDICGEENLDREIKSLIDVIYPTKG